MGYCFLPMTAKHRDEVLAIFNHYVKESFAAYPITPVGPEAFGRWTASIGEHPALVALAENGRVSGFAFLRPYHPAESFKSTAEITYFLSPEYARKGLGTAFLERLEEEARVRGIQRILASISSRNEASLGFHRRHGFTEVGRFPAIGRKFGENFDVVWMMKCLES